MLTPRQLLAETAKFFKLHPSQFLVGGLTGSGTNPADALPGDCFCTVGYMAHRLAQESLQLEDAVRSDAYVAVGRFLRSRFGYNANRLFSLNDSLKDPYAVADRLVAEARKLEDA